MPKPRQSEPDDPFQDEDWGHPETPATESDEMPPPSAEDRPPFLKPHMLKENRGTMELIRVTKETSEYSDVVFLVAIGQKHFRLGLKFFSPDYKALANRFGPKKSDWKGTLQFKVMPHKGNPRGYVAVR
jgi:hypothetical protein